MRIALCRGPRGLQGLQGLLGRIALFPALRGQLGLPGLRVPPDPLGRQVQLGQQALIVMFPALLVLRDLQAIPVPLALPDLQARRVMLALLAPLDLPDLKETLAQLGLLDLRVIRAFKASKVPQGLQGRPDPQGVPDQSDLLAPPGCRELSGLPGQRGQRDRRELRV